MHTHTVQWQAPSPIWSAALKDESSNKRFRQPTLLRFANDNFMDEFTASLENAEKEETAVTQYVAQYENWQYPKVGWVDDPPTDANALKLYHPAHQRFYLVAASLVCRIPGLPDRIIDSANDEKVSFVLRRLVPDENNATTQEYGWFTGLGWRLVPRPLGVDDFKAGEAAFAEERLPMFPMSYGENGSRRRMLAGFLPVGSRESYEAPAAINPLVVEADDDPLADYRVVQFETAVFGGFKGLLEALDNDKNINSVELAQEIMLFAMLDLADFIDDYLIPNWDTTNLASKTFFDTIKWDTALNNIRTEKEKIIDGTQTTLSFISNEMIVSDDEETSLINIRNAVDELQLFISTTENDAYELKDGFFDEDDFTTASEDVFSQLNITIPTVPKYDTNAGAVYVVRCVYEKLNCPTFAPIISQETSVPFQLAPFFDPDAPARPIRIAMPIDTSISGLRKFPKNVSFLISNELRKQMDRVQNIDLDDLSDIKIPGENPGINIGMICSLSIPIITICALILLMIIVSLLNMIFFWLPFFKICLPISIDVE